MQRFIKEKEKYARKVKESKKEDSLCEPDKKTKKKR